MLIEYIISYQMITGNYSADAGDAELLSIISYQMITGNYSLFGELLLC